MLFWVTHLHLTFHFHLNPRTVLAKRQQITTWILNGYHQKYYQIEPPLLPRSLQQQHQRICLAVICVAIHLTLMN